jgi:2-hydroxychromene-2-carboxylate isomerase
MFHYGDEWYWGVDRLGHLEERLLELAAVRTEDATRRFTPPPETCRARNASQVTLEFFPSLRSPYSYIAMARVGELAKRSGVQLVFRPVLPMVMRGLPVARRKGQYIMMDVAREAERLELPFGRITDPLGRPVERAYSLFQWARERGKEGELLHSFARGAFADAIDTGTNPGIRQVVERAGLSFAAAAEALDSELWRTEFEGNRRTLYAAGLWGVPSFRVSGPSGHADYATWGQDRLFRVAQEIEQRAG